MGKKKLILLVWEKPKSSQCLEQPPLWSGPWFHSWATSLQWSYRSPAWRKKINIRNWLQKNTKQQRKKQKHGLRVENNTCRCVCPSSGQFCRTTPECWRRRWGWGRCRTRWSCRRQTPAQWRRSSGWSGCCRTPSCSCWICWRDPAREQRASGQQSVTESRKKTKKNTDVLRVEWLVPVGPRG